MVMTGNPKHFGFPVITINGFSAFQLAPNWKALKPLMVMTGNPKCFGFPVITINGFSAFQLGASWPKIVGPDGNLQLVDHLSVLRGKHALKLGAEFLHVTGTVYVTTNAKGSIRFASLPAFVTGNTSGAGSGPDRIFVGDPGRNLHNELYAGFFQDDWRIRPRLTINAGVRYELNTVLKESRNRLGNFDPAV